MAQNRVCSNSRVEIVSKTAWLVLNNWKDGNSSTVEPLPHHGKHSIVTPVTLVTPTW